MDAREKIRLEQEVGRARLREIQNDLDTARGLRVMPEAAPPEVMDGRFEMVDLPPLKSARKKKKSEVDELLESLQQPQEDDDGDRDPD
jgi:hypothetical protein